MKLVARVVPDVGDVDSTASQNCSTGNMPLAWRQWVSSSYRISALGRRVVDGFEVNQVTLYA